MYTCEAAGIVFKNTKDHIVFTSMRDDTMIYVTVRYGTIIRYGTVRYLYIYIYIYIYMHVYLYIYIYIYITVRYKYVTNVHARRRASCSRAPETTSCPRAPETLGSLGCGQS